MALERGRMNDPADYPRRLLLAVVGLTPQVVTETLFALAVTRRPAFLPTAVHLITTAEGAERIHLQLLDEETGAYRAFASDYAPSLSSVLADTTVTVLAAADGRPLGDIASAEDGMAAADTILHTVRVATADAEVAICASIAGGRKTMGFQLGYAMSLFARQQDWLTHVLAGRDFEDNPGFFYPPPRPRVLFATRDNRPVRTDAARIALTEIPFVRLRDGLPHRMLDGSASFAETVAEAQQALTPPDLLLDPHQRIMLCQGRKVRLPPVEFAFVLWLAHRRLSHAPYGGALSWREADASEFLAIYDWVSGPGDGHRGRIARSLRHGIGQDWVEQRVTRINKLVKAALGLVAAQYQIVPYGNRPNTRHGLSDNLKSITIADSNVGAEE